jgi:type I restriction enzyme S subunit
MSDYRQIKLKYVANIYNGNSIPDDQKDNYMGKSIPYIPTKELDSEDGSINYENGLSVDVNDGFRIAPAESVLMCIEGGSAGKKIGITNQPVAFVNKLCCFAPIRIDPFLLYYCLKSKDFTDQFNLNMTGLIGGVSVSTLKNLFITIPSSIGNERIIADRIKEQIAKIDLLIANQLKQIENLKEYKQTIVFNAVTKGLRSEVPLKESDAEWIGSIPEHWTTCRIKDLFSLRNERNYEALEDVNLISLYTDQGVVQHSDLTETTGNKAVTADGYKKVYKNDIVVNIILCWMGAVGMSKYDGVTSPAYDIYQPKNNTESEYYHFLFRTPRFNGECFRYGRGIMLMRWRTYSTEFSSIRVPNPPIEEQKEIVEYLNDKTEKIDTLIGIKLKKIESLQQYKKSIIYEYVTGKKEVQ